MRIVCFVLITLQEDYANSISSWNDRLSSLCLNKFLLEGIEIRLYVNSDYVRLHRLNYKNKK